MKTAPKPKAKNTKNTAPVRSAKSYTIQLSDEESENEGEKCNLDFGKKRDSFCWTDGEAPPAFAGLCPNIPPTAPARLLLSHKRNGISTIALLRSCEQKYLKGLRHLNAADRVQLDKLIQGAKNMGLGREYGSFFGRNFSEKVGVLGEKLTQGRIQISEFFRPTPGKAPDSMEMAQNFVRALRAVGVLGEADCNDSLHLLGMTFKLGNGFEDLINMVLQDKDTIRLGPVLVSSLQGRSQVLLATNNGKVEAEIKKEFQKPTLVILKDPCGGGLCYCWRSPRDLFFLSAG